MSDVLALSHLRNKGSNQPIGSTVNQFVDVMLHQNPAPEPRQYLGLAKTSPVPCKSQEDLGRRGFGA